MIDAGDQEVRKLEEIGQDPFWPARPTFPKTHYTLYHPSIPMECRPFGIDEMVICLREEYEWGESKWGEKGENGEGKKERRKRGGTREYS